MKDNGQMNVAFDFGEGRQADVEFGGKDQLWVAAGFGLTRTDLWLKNGGGKTIDLRVRVRRTPMGIEISVDRGDDQRAWWPATSVPRLTIDVNRSDGIASVAASVGRGSDFQEVSLGETSI